MLSDSGFKVLLTYDNLGEVSKPEAPLAACCEMLQHSGQQAVSITRHGTTNRESEQARGPSEEMNCIWQSEQ